MKILFKFPSRSRPELFRASLGNLLSSLSGKHIVTILVSLDDDDPCLPQYFAEPDMGFSTIKAVVGKSGSKVQAINRDIDQVYLDWEIIIPWGDDHRAALCFDDTICRDMQEYFPNLDGALHYKIGQGNDEMLCLLPIMGRKLYDSFGYFAHPDYLSEYCDNEFTDVTRAAGKLIFVAKTPIRHEWVGNHAPDKLHQRNLQHGQIDRRTYELRKQAGYPAKSVLK